MQPSDHCGPVFSVDGLIVRVVAAPDGAPGLVVVQLEIEGHARRQYLSVDLPEAIQVSTKEIVSTNVAARGINVLVASRSLKLSQQNVLNPLCPHLAPSPKFISAPCLPST